MSVGGAVMDSNRREAAKRLVDVCWNLSRTNWHQSPVAGLRSSEMWTLYCIKKNTDLNFPGIKISEISTFLRVTSPSVTQLINSLEAQGLVERNIDTEDRRAVRIKITEKGERILRKAAKALHELFGGLVEYLGEKNTNLLADLLSQVLSYFDSVRASDI
jgi:DNA-binding MarR family transcriptional regulator